MWWQVLKISLGAWMYNNVLRLFNFNLEKNKDYIKSVAGNFNILFIPWPLNTYILFISFDSFFSGWPTLFWQLFVTWNIKLNTPGIIHVKSNKGRIEGKCVIFVWIPEHNVYPFSVFYLVNISMFIDCYFTDIIIFYSNTWDEVSYKYLEIEQNWIWYTKSMLIKKCKCYLNPCQYRFMKDVSLQT